MTQKQTKSLLTYKRVHYTNKKILVNTHSHILTFLYYYHLAIDPRRSCPHRQFHTLNRPFTQLGCTAKLLPKCRLVKQGGSLCQIHDGLWYDPAGA